MNGLCTVIERTVGMDVFTVLHTGADGRFVHSNWENCWYGCVYGTAYRG
jgi:NAD-dependent dihydropyrimidine dehydrogenase PreA subunit